MSLAQISMAEFDMAPARYVRPDHAAAALGLPVGLAEALLGRERFGERLSMLLITGLCLLPCRDVAIAEPDRRLALQPAAAIAALPRLFGCLWHAGPIRHVIARDERRAVIDAVGAPLHGVLLRNPTVGLAVPPEPGKRLVEQIDPHGAALVGHWLDGLPPAFAERLRLMLPPALAPEEDMPSPDRHEMAALIEGALLISGQLGDG